MNRLLVVTRSLVHSWRRQVGLLLGTAVASAVLVGALAVGDSVRASLRRLTAQRIGAVDAVLAASDRLFRRALADGVAASPDVAAAAPLLRLRGLVGTPDGAHRARDVQVLGVDERFFALAPSGRERPPPAPGEALLNPRLARQLEVAPGDEVVLRVEMPSALPREAALAEDQDVARALRVKVAGVLEAEDFGNFSLEAHQVPPSTCVLAAGWLDAQVEAAGRANVLALRGARRDEGFVGRADAALEAALELADLQLELTGREGIVELTSPRIFLDPPVEEVVRALPVPALGVLTYFVNEIRAGERAVPYSTVAALGPLTEAALPDGGPLAAQEVVPADLPADALVVNDWLARELAISPGDEVELRYYVLSADVRLEEAVRRLRVHAVVPMRGLAADPELMPAFPGLKDSENCRDWEPGIPVDLQRIRPADEEYWDRHRGTPKAFLSLAAGQQIFGSRFGSLTAVRMQEEQAGVLREALHERLDPARLGLYFQDLRGGAQASSHTATDFGSLFLGLSLFLIGAAVMLTTLLFVFGVEQREAEIGTLLAIGFRRRQVRGLFLAEAALVAVAGALGGVFLGMGYTRLVLRGLSSLWQDAVASAQLSFHVTPWSLAGGAGGAVVVALAALALALRRQVRRPAAELLRGVAGVSAAARAQAAGAGVAATLAVAGLVGCAVLLGMAGDDGGPAAAGAFFGAGSALLLSALCGCRLLLVRARRDFSERPSLWGLAFRNCQRRPGRSLATVGLLAAGTFLVVALGVNQLAAPREWTRRDAGTGGFALVGETSLPVVQNLNEPTGREVFGLLAEELAGISFVALRQGPGDEASCRNLSLSQNPRLYGAPAGELARRAAFAFARTLGEGESEAPWELLQAELPGGVVPAIGDQASVTWSLHKKVGDELEYRDERGRPFRVCIVATVQNSILQGMLLIDEQAFQGLYPSAGGYRFFLVDAPPERVNAVSATLGRALADVGLGLETTSARLAEFNAVQNTYLTIFQTLSGLGVLLGTAGLAVVVLRNVLERRAELAACRAVGFSRGAICRLVLGEHGLLLALGLLSGTAAGLGAILPAGRAALSTAPFPLVAAIALSGILWVLAAASWATRGPLTTALRAD